jgi:hypothetical protein
MKIRVLWSIVLVALSAAVFLAVGLIGRSSLTGHEQLASAGAAARQNAKPPVGANQRATAVAFLREQAAGSGVTSIATKETTWGIVERLGNPWGGPHNSRFDSPATLPVYLSLERGSIRDGQSGGFGAASPNYSWVFIVQPVQHPYEVLAEWSGAPGSPVPTWFSTVQDLGG